MSDRADATTLRRDMPFLFETDGPDMTWRVERPLGIAKIQIFGGDPDTRFRHVFRHLPPERLRQVEHEGLTHAWLAPGEWLSTGEEDTVATLLTRIGEQGGAEMLAIDLTHARTAFVLTGSQARTALSAYCPLDLCNAAFPIGAVARSLLGETGMFVARLGDRADGPRFRIIVDQAMAAYVARMMAAVAPPGGFREQ